MPQFEGFRKHQNLSTDPPLWSIKSSSKWSANDWNAKMSINTLHTSLQCILFTMSTFQSKMTKHEKKWENMIRYGEHPLSPYPIIKHAIKLFDFVNKIGGKWYLVIILINIPIISWASLYLFKNDIYFLVSELITCSAHVPTDQVSCWNFPYWFALHI